MKRQFVALSLVLGLTVALGACQAPEEGGTTLPEGGSETEQQEGIAPAPGMGEEGGEMTQPGVAPGESEESESGAGAE